MKIKFYAHEYFWPKTKTKPECRYIARCAKLENASSDMNFLYKTYIFDAISSDFNERDSLSCDKVLKEIKKIEAEEKNEYTWHGNSFIHHIKKNCVSFEHAIFGDCLEWPIQSFPILHYKTALEGWKKFSTMPNLVSSELIIDLPKNIEDKI